MPKFTQSRIVLASPNLAASKAWYCEVLGFREEPIEADGWAFLERDGLRLMIGDCPDALPPASLGDHSWYVHITTDDAQSLCQEIRDRGGEILSDVADRPWGLRDFCVRTIDGHRIVFAQPIG